MNLKDVSLKSKIMVPVTVMVAVGIIITIIVTTGKTKSIVIDEAKHTTLAGFRDTVLNTLTTMMITGNFKEAKSPFLEQMSHIADVHVIRAEVLDKEYGKGKPEEYPKDAIAKDMEKMADDVMHEVDALAKIAEELRSSTAGFKTRGEL